MAKVFMVPLNDNPTLAEQAAAVTNLAEISHLADKISVDDFVAIKLHIGEAGNTTYVKPELIKALVKVCEPSSKNIFLTETSTLYKGQRDNAVKHIMLAQKHGFGIEQTGAPWIMADGLTGNSEVEVVIPGPAVKKVKIAREIALTDVPIAVSHPTGHMISGLGACLKNLGMGLSSRAGKLRQHSSVLPEIDATQCIFCQKCIKWCPAGAIANVRQKAFIQAEQCLGCGECLTVCRHDAIKFNWGIQSEQLQQSVAEYAGGVLQGKKGKVLFINVLVGMTAECDCVQGKQPKLIPDLVFKLRRSGGY